MRYALPVIIFLLLCCPSLTCAWTIQGSVRDRQTNEALTYCNVQVAGSSYGATTDDKGNFEMQLPDSLRNHRLIASYMGYVTDTLLLAEGKENYEFNLSRNAGTLEEVVISGTMKEVSKLESPVPVEIYTAKFFKTNPTPSIFDALQNVNGVRPQLNCNVCNTGDIHINGLEGPYTMVLIDGMPIVSGLSSVYGLSGIPQSLIDRVEVVKGPASTLYGSEAVGGLINIITKKTTNAPTLAADIFGTSWGEFNTDFSGKFNAGKNAQSLLGVNYFNYLIPVDNNKDGFTDVTLQNRISLFNKWNFDRPGNRVFSLAARYVYENRWGGDMDWNKSFRGGDSIYGESIYTRRWEFFGTYQLPFKEKIVFQFSANGHNQNSVYGNMSFLAKQYIGFGQLTWNKPLKRNDLLTGFAYRYIFYDDNTPATATADTVGASGNLPSNTQLPGIFIQDEITINEKNKLLVGLRYDYNSVHGSILTPRINYKWTSKDKNNVLRLSIGNGYRVANIFTEDHAALTGSREVIFLEDLDPETSWNTNINYVRKIYGRKGNFLGIDATGFFTFFNNKIIADYTTDARRIVYDNLDGYAISQGLSVNLDINFEFGLKIILGGTYMDVFSVEDKVKTRQLFTEKFTGVWNVSYTFSKIGLVIDYTGNLYSPMPLPLLNNNDPRRAYSPWWSIQNIQFTKKFKNGIEIYAGVKNLLNWTPNKGNPFIIARSGDPFNKQVQYDTNGQAIATTENPYGLVFDPAYVYGPNQGIRGFFGLRYSFYKVKL